MKKFENYVKKLNGEANIPENVETQFEETLSELGNNRAKKKFSAAWVKAAAIAGAIVIGGTAFCYTNPVVAAKIPIIGKIFELVEDNVEFSGKYVHKETLQDETKGSNVYTAESNGVTVKASEVYSDGYSVFLTTEIRVENGGMNNVESSYTSRFGKTKSQYLYTEGKWKINKVKDEKELVNNYIEGKSMDDNTFIGMIKLDKDSYSIENGNLNINLTSIGYDDKNKEMKNEYDDCMVTIKGNWNLSVPYSVDKENSKEIAVNKKNKDGFGIEKIFVSPYQVVVFSDVPYTKLNPDKYTRQDHEEKYGQKNQQIIDDGGQPFTYEEALNQKNYAYYELALFDQDGNALEFANVGDGSNINDTYSVKDLEISKLHIYMGDESNMYKLLKATDEKTASEKAIFDVEVKVK